MLCNAPSYWVLNNDFNLDGFLGQLCNAPSYWVLNNVVELMSLTKFMLCNAPSYWVLNNTDSR